MPTKINIRPVKYADSRQIKLFLEEVNVAVDSTFNPENIPDFHSGLVSKFHSLLPLHWKFLQESYIALENKEVMGIVTLIPDCKSRLRWKINQILLKPNSYYAGKLLIDFIVNKYGAEGVETLLSEVDSTDIDALDLFKNACGFRQCTVNNIYVNNLEGNLSENMDINGLRRTSLSDARSLYDLYLECLTPQAKMSLDKSVSDFSFNFIDTLKNRYNGFDSYNWVLDHPDNDSLIVYANIKTRDNKVFSINIITSLPHSDLFYDVLNYLIRFAGLKNSHATVLINVCEAIQSSRKYMELLKQMQLAPVQTNYILVKDYWRPIKERKPVAAPIAIFADGGTSPACNSFKKHATNYVVKAPVR